MYTTLVTTEELAARLGDPQWVVFDCRFTLSDPAAGRHAYHYGHIPGARYADLNQDLSSPVTARTGRHPLPDPKVLAEKLGRWGVDDGKQVVAYDSNHGAMAAARLWWLLRWLGHKQVAVLDGDLRKWERESRPITTELPVITPTVFPLRVHDEYWVGSEVVAQLSAGGQGLIVDARGEERFTGEREPFDSVAGHIPGAINAPFEDNLAPGGTFLTREDLGEHFRALLKGRHHGEVVHSCGSGVTACHNLLAMEHAGLRGARLYAGSWSEWIRDPARPVATGE